MIEKTLADKLVDAGEAMFFCCVRVWDYNHPDAPIDALVREMMVTGEYAFGYDDNEFRRHMKTETDQERWKWLMLGLKQYLSYSEWHHHREPRKAAAFFAQAVPFLFRGLTHVMSRKWMDGREATLPYAEAYAEAAKFVQHELWSRCFVGQEPIGDDVMEFFGLNQ